MVGFSASLVQPLDAKYMYVVVLYTAGQGHRKAVAKLSKAERLSPPSAVGKEGGKNVGRRSSAVGESHT